LTGKGDKVALPKKAPTLPGLQRLLAATCTFSDCRNGFRITVHGGVAAVGGRGRGPLELAGANAEHLRNAGPARI